MKGPIGFAIMRGIKMSQVPAFMRNECVMDRDGTVWMRMQVESNGEMTSERGGGLRWA
jgi:hypothetical protein